jgi:hypothetical protein
MTCQPVNDGNGDANKLCSPAIPGASGSIGAACDITNPKTCYTCFCFPNDPRGTSTAGYCADTCCTDADCTAPSGARCRLVDNGLGLPDGGGAGGYIGLCLKQ